MNNVTYRPDDYIIGQMAQRGGRKSLLTRRDLERYYRALDATTFAFNEAEWTALEEMAGAFPSLPPALANKVRALSPWERTALIDRIEQRKIAKENKA